MKTVRFLLFALMAIAPPIVPQALSAEDERTITPIPPRGLVPDEATAVRIAEAIFIAFYGEQVLQQRPFRAALHGNQWYVHGTLKANAVGGTAFAAISKRDARVVQFFHSK